MRRAEINPRELLFEKIPACYGEPGFDQTAQDLKESKKILDDVFITLKKQAYVNIKREFGKTQNVSLKACLLMNAFRTELFIKNHVPQRQRVTLNYLEKLLPMMRRN